MNLSFQHLAPVQLWKSKEKCSSSRKWESPPTLKTFFFLFPVDSSSLVGNRKCHRLITTRSARERFCDSWLYVKFIDLLRRPRDSCHLVPSSFQSRYGGIHKVDWNSVTLSETLWARLLLWTIYLKLETICARPYSMSIYTLCRAEFEQKVKFKLWDYVTFSILLLLFFRSLSFGSFSTAVLSCLA